MASHVQQGLLIQLRNAREFFERATAALEEKDSAFAPTPEMYSVASQVAHVALTVDWFMDGVFVNNAFDMDFEKHDSEARAVKSLAEARAMIVKSFERAEKIVGEADEATLFSPIAPQGIMDGAPKMASIHAITDHTAHHRGSLAVYARLLGKVPPMPYM